MRKATTLALMFLLTLAIGPAFAQADADRGRLTQREAIELTESLDRDATGTPVELKQAAQKLGVSPEVVRQFVGRLHDITAARLEDTLEEIAFWHHHALRFLAWLPADAQALVSSVEAALNRGDYDSADGFVAEAEQRDLVQGQQDGAPAHMTRASIARSMRARIAMAHLDYLTATQHYRAAIAMTPEADQSLRWQHNVFLVDLLERHGEHGNEAALREALDGWRKMLLDPYSREQLIPAEIQAHIASVLLTMGERESGTARLEEAATAYRLVLRETDRTREPRRWATMQNNVAYALKMLGERESGTGRLAEAVAAFRLVLEDSTREREPLEWARLQHTVGDLLATWGERENDTVRLEESVAAYRLALQERTPEKVPLYWAETQSRLGAVLVTLGRRESGTARLEEAAAAYRKAMEELQHRRGRVEWTKARRGLDLALALLAARRG